MNKIPKNLKYTKDHEWAIKNKEIITIGITYYAQKQLGDIVYLELPENGTIIKKKDQFGTVESIKAVSDLITPISGKIISINNDLIENPEKINLNPYDDSWMIKIHQTNCVEFDSLINAKEYNLFLTTILK